MTSGELIKPPRLRPDRGVGVDVVRSTRSFYGPILMSPTAPGVLTGLARVRGCDPAVHLVGTGRSGITDALWANRSDQLLELVALPHPDHRSLTIRVVPARQVVVSANDRPTFSKPASVGCGDLRRAGDRTAAVYDGPFKILQSPIPTRLAADPISREGLEAPPPAVGLIDPGRVFDPVIAGVGREMLVRMCEAGPFFARHRVDVREAGIAASGSRNDFFRCATRCASSAHGCAAPRREPGHTTRRHAYASVMRHGRVSPDREASCLSAPRPRRKRPG